jgi:dienelactone hydrolase
MKKTLLLGYLVMALHLVGSAQNVFDPADPIIRYDKTKPYGSAQRPDTTKFGLQKWVSTPVNGVSQGSGAYDASSFKQYFINIGNGKMAFRVKFPKSYNNPDSAGKKYPINLFLHGGGEVGCPSNGGIYNNERPLWLGGQFFRDLVDNNKFDGFLLYPQFVIYNGCFAGWLEAPTSAFSNIVAMIDSMERYVRADVDRVVITGLSGGAYGAWRMAEGFPRRVAKIIPSAGTGVNSNRNAFVHIPIWFATGGKDPDPSPAMAQAALDKMLALGADIRYTQYPEKGHSMWDNHWREPDFVPSLNQIHKANPLVFFQRTGYCSEAAVDAKLGITAGFNAYEWEKDGVLIATSALGILNPSVVSNFTGNEITVTKYGIYRVRFKRYNGGNWSVWSPKPAVITTKSATQAVPIVVKGAKSKVLPALDGSTTVPLTMPDGFVNYQWYNSDNQQLATTQVYQAAVGTYKSRYEEQFGCGTEFSPLFKVVDANGSPKPAVAQNLAAAPFTQSINKLTWTDGAGETGYEVYRATSSGGPFQFIRLTNANATSFNDSNLVKNTVYYYVVRAVSETGASVASNEATVKTLIDNVPPTAPSNLVNQETSSPNAQVLNWTASTDNIGVDHYDIFVNGEKLYSTTETTFIVTRLDSLYPYRFIVKAVDSSGNFSPASNQATYIPAGTPAGTVPGIPSTVTATPSSYNKINISWTDNSSNETGFEIFRSETENGTYITVGTIDSNKVSFTDSALSPSKQYFYKIKAIGQYGESGFSNTVNASTPAAPATPVAPTEMVGVSGENNTVTISWNDNASNETKYNIYRSTDGTTFTLVGSIPANTNAYTDTDVQPQNYYSYYVAGENGSGVGASSDTIRIRAGNKAPIINSLENIFVKAGATATDDFSVTDDPGDVITVTATNRPAFVTITTISEGNYRITAKPSSQQVGSYTMTITATDNNGKSSTQDIIINVADKNTKTVYVNLGSTDKAATGAWNNWLGARLAGDVLNSIKDENNTASNITVTSLSDWSLTNNMGHISGNNSGVFPDDVLASGFADAGTEKMFRIGGLNSARQYNLVFVGSMNEGINATATYTAGTQTVVLNARNNTNFTANLNNLSPNSSGEILVTINRDASSPLLYLNGFAIEEVEAGVQLLYPDHVYAEPLDRTSNLITWSDRTNNESGYELYRALDSSFTKEAIAISLPANTKTYTDTALTPNTKYWYGLRAKNGNNYSEYSRIVKAITPESIVYVNFNVTVENAPAPWNNLESAPMFAFTSPILNDQFGAPTNMTMTLVSEFNGEFTAGVNTENNSGVAPDNVLRANYWLDREQLSQMRINGLNHSKRYRIGFLGSSSPPVWFKGNYTAKYSVHGKTVYLNSWENSTKIVYVDDLAPDEDGTLMLNFSTTPEAGYGFNSGVIIEEFNDIQLQDTIPVDTIPTTPIDTIPEPPVDPIDSVKASIKVFPNPVQRDFVITFFNNQENDPVAIEVYDPQGRRTYSKDYGARPAGNNSITISSFEARMRSGIYLVALKMNGKLVKTVKIIKNRL